MEKSGMLSLIKVSDKESDLYLEYLRKSCNTPAYDFINYLIGKDYIQFLDLIAGSNLKVPNRKSLYKDLECIKIYGYVREHGMSMDALKCAAKIYNKRLSYVKRVVVRMSKVIDGVIFDIK